MINESCITGKQESEFRSREEFEEFKLEFYEALLDMVEELRRIKAERQKEPKEDTSKSVSSQR